MERSLLFGRWFPTPQHVEITFDVKDLVSAAHTDTEPDRDRQLKQFGVVEMFTKSIPQILVDSGVVDGEAFCVFSSQAFSIREVGMIVVVLYLLVELV